MSLVLLGIGLVLVIEGLVFALAPSRLDDLVQMMAAMSRDQRRMIGLVALALGVLLVWLSGAGT
ncbi:DUF2065 family protein [Aliiroseovarius sp. S1123]|jgi:uncharacterized protein YjeT (DUF2065 family)|uniref:DUF2065 family protein n=1 Tax=unclassified Aliiroseovarius TaxID=2623558 RepID=UPI001FF4EF71|nr:DUF2065 family protein [Aliiroseovarius sp. S1123]MCK0169924.1 DUF2065 family protein [Aliiroseovarius sp. S1123]